MNDAEQRTAWSSLAKDEQTALLIAFGHHLDGLPPTCSMDVKEQRLRDWLGQRGIDYPGAG
jgi:hypothetical protein